MLFKQTRTAANDIQRGLALYKTWSYLAYQDVGARYRRSLLGPFWIAAGTVAQAASMTIVYGAIMHLPLAQMLPYIMGGLVVFNFMGIPFTDGCETYTGAASTIRAYPLPYSFHIFRMVLRALVVMAHNLVVYFLVVFLCERTVHVTPMIIPAVLLITFFVVCASTITATISLRFRDVRFLLPYLWQILFFSTPVFWRADSFAIGDKRRMIFEYNPIYYLMEVVRRPLLGEQIAPHIWPVAITIVAILAPMAFIVFALFRKRIALWV
jgi:ABC-type polysaccharide/polyol phosphate export permease